MNWKGELCQHLTFVAAPILGALGVLLAFRAAAPERWTSRRFLHVAVALFLLTRVGTHLVVFHLFRYAGADDLLEFWVPMARAVLDGRDPGPFADNLSGPLFPYVTAAGLGWSGGRYAPGVDLPFVVADALALLLLLRIARRRVTEAASRRLVLAATLSPLVFLGVTVSTQDESLFVFFLLWTLDLSERGRVLPAAAVAALGTLFTKALFPLWALPVLLAGDGGSRGAVRRVGTAAAFTAVGLAAAFACGWGPAERPEISRVVFGTSAWTFFDSDGRVSSTTFHLGLAATAALAIVAAFVATRRRSGESTSDGAARGVVAVQAAFFAASPYTIPLHLVHGLPFLAWQALREGAAETRPSAAALALLAGFAAWQIPAFAVEASWWPGCAPLLAAFVAFWAWTGRRAVAAAWPSAVTERSAAS
jgi:hypothetical protein